MKNLFLMTAMTLVLGCGTGEVTIDDGSNGSSEADQEERWGSREDPSIFNGTLEYRLSELPARGEAKVIPWAGNYWPVYQDSINYKWDGASSESASKKYERAFGGTNVEDAVSRNHGIESMGTEVCTSSSQCRRSVGEVCAKRPGNSSGRCIPTWWGVCHAWTPAAILLPEPKHAVTRNGVTFKVQDLKALATLVHNKTESKFISLRCGASDYHREISYDQYGRPTGDDAACRDTNAGTLHVLLANFLGKQGRSFAEDRIFDDEVWNQPLRGYKVLEKRTVTAAQANQLIGVLTSPKKTYHRTGTVSAGQLYQKGSVAVTEGQQVVLQLSGTGSAGLVARFGSAPTTTAADCRPAVSGMGDRCTLTAPSGVTALYVAVKGVAATSTFEIEIVVGGGVPAQYTFNPDAKSFAYLRTQVQYISESSAETDGNLRSRIDSYTGTDTYEYVLELDAAGKILGGEWVGESKKLHPDFLWLPLKASTPSVAGGAITYAQVKSLIDESVR